jgi:hypothetical protein
MPGRTHLQHAPAGAAYHHLSLTRGRSCVTSNVSRDRGGAGLLLALRRFCACRQFLGPRRTTGRDRVSASSGRWSNSMDATAAAMSWLSSRFILCWSASTFRFLPRDHPLEYPRVRFRHP